MEAKLTGSTPVGRATKGPLTMEFSQIDCERDDVRDLVALLAPRETDG